MNEWLKFRDAVHRSIGSGSPLLEELTNDLAMTMWRLRRVIRHENALIDAKYRAVDYPDSYTAPAVQVSAIEEWLTRKGGNLERCTVLLESLKGMPHDAELVEPEWQLVIHLLRLSKYDVKKAMDDVPGRMRVTTSGSLREWISDIAKACGISYGELIRSSLIAARTELKAIEERDRLHERQRENLQTNAILPRPEDMERLIRLEAHLDRRRSKLLVQIERIQRAESGENLPPPLDVHVTED